MTLGGEVQFSVYLTRALYNSPAVTPAKAGVHLSELGEREELLRFHESLSKDHCSRWFIRSSFDNRSALPNNGRVSRVELYVIQM